VENTVDARSPAPAGKQNTEAANRKNPSISRFIAATFPGWSPA